MELFKSRARVVYTNAVGDKVYPVVVDIKKGIKSTEEVTFVSSDINTGILSVAFVQGNEVYNVSGAEVVCSVMRPDASTLEIPCEVVSGNIVEVPLGVNGTSQDGVYSMDFKIFKGGNKVVGTPIMNYSVSLSIGNDMVVEEDDRLPILTMLMTQVGTLKEEATSVISQANDTIELARVATNNAVDATNNANATIEEVKVMTNEAVSRVDNSISVVNNTVNEKVVEMNTAKVDMTNTVSNKINEVEKRFNNLTSSQQQSSEVIDARDGEVSLKARLDRDIEKAKEIYVGVEGTYVSTDSSSGYAKYVEILGNTIQNAENLADIRSVGDKVEGQELYEIDVLITNENLFNINDYKKGGFYEGTGFVPNNNSYYSEKFINIKPNTTYHYLASDGHYRNSSYTVFYDKNKNFISELNDKISVTSPSNARYMRVSPWENSIDIDNPLDYIGEKKEYSQYQEDKLTILSPVQLEKVGDVRDRIVCKDGVWGVEKNVGNITLDITKDWRFLSSNNTVWYPAKHDAKIWSQSISSVACKIDFDSANNIVVTKDGLSSLEEYKSIMPIYVKYQLAQSTFIPLPHDQQVKLRTFAGQTNIHFETEIEGTIKAQVPKSLGATVNTHTEQINNLNKELDRVKKLEESTVSTVTTESGFTTVEETANGYFEDVKLEGKTLVNIVTTYDTSKFIFKDAIKQEDGYYKLQYGATVNNSYVIPRYGVHLYKPNTTYTIIVDIKENTTGTLLGISAINSCIDSTTISKRDFANLTGISTITFKTRDDITISDKGVPPTYDLYFGIWKDGGDLSKHITFRYWVLEGDHTQNPPSYFEGLKSVGGTTDEIVVSSVKGDGNLFDGQLEEVSIDTTYNGKFGQLIPSSSDFCSHTKPFMIKPNTTYVVGINDTTRQALCFMYDCNMNPLNFEYGNGSKEFTTPSNARYCRVRFGLILTEAMNYEMYLIEKDSTDLTHQSDKKRLLYYNEETQTWEKPILRQWDSIEKHSDGKYYYHKRSGEVVLNGSEEIGTYSESDSNDVMAFTIRISNNSVAGCICDRFMYKLDYGLSANYENIFTPNNNYLQIRILKSKLSTQDAQGFKAWLRANPTTVVYQLANEEVYECTNIDLITYANETNYIVSSGVIVPKTTLKVHNNISNVVKILQEKVSLLENKFIQGLKQVLAGDMYSLAELLYPEDFKAENSVMTIPLD